MNTAARSRKDETHNGHLNGYQNTHWKPECSSHVSFQTHYMSLFKQWKPGCSWRLLYIGNQNDHRRSLFKQLVWKETWSLTSSDSVLNSIDNFGWSMETSGQWNSKQNGQCDSKQNGQCNSKQNGQWNSKQNPKWSMDPEVDSGLNSIDHSVLNSIDHPDSVWIPLTTSGLIFSGTGYNVWNLNPKP